MMQVRFYDKVEDCLLEFAVIVSRYNGKWVFCKHKARDTYECPGGHREAGGKIEATAKRELWEETGAEDFLLSPICVYSVSGADGSVESEHETFGMLYYANIKAVGQLPPLEMEKIQMFDDFPQSWTYPQIQPLLFKKVMEVMKIG